MRPRPVHRWTGGLLGRHRLTAEELAVPGDPWAPRLRRCACRWVLGLRVGDLPGCEELPDAEVVLWTPRWVLERAMREVW
jgi:hypothetical protein